MTPAGGHDVGYIRVSSFSQNTDRQLDGIELQASAKPLNQIEELATWLKSQVKLEVSNHLEDIPYPPSDLTPTHSIFSLKVCGNDGVGQFLQSHYACTCNKSLLLF